MVSFKASGALTPSAFCFVFSKIFWGIFSFLTVHSSDKQEIREDNKGPKKKSALNQDHCNSTVCILGHKLRRYREEKQSWQKVTLSQLHLTVWVWSICKSQDTQKHVSAITYTYFTKLKCCHIIVISIVIFIGFDHFY